MKFNRQIVSYMVLAAVLVLCILYFGQMAAFAKTLGHIMRPLFFGSVIAYILNLLMRFLERFYFPKSTHKLAAKTRRPVCLLLSILLILLILFTVFNLVIPQIINTFSAIAAALPAYTERINGWLAANRDQIPIVAKHISEININWENIVKRVATYTTQGVSSILNSSVSIITLLTTGIFNLFVALTFAIYLLLGKDRLLRQARQLQRALMKEDTAARLNTVLTITNESFFHFIVGQCTEALVIGSLCTLGMWVFRFPYATAIGAFVGVTSFIPIFGAYLGAGVGAFLILIIDPLKSLLFLLFIVVLQQLEGNLIYPKIVGSSMGLPGIWVFAAVIIGGGLGGILGMLLGVPVAATAYKLLQIYVKNRLKGEPVE